MCLCWILMWTAEHRGDNLLMCVLNVGWEDPRDPSHAWATRSSPNGGSRPCAMSPWIQQRQQQQ